MEKKSLTVSAVVNEIESLAIYYEEKIKEKEQEVLTLTDVTNDMQERIIQLERHNRMLKPKKRDFESNYDMLFSYASSTNYTTLEDYLIDHRDASNAIVLLRYLKYAIEHNNILKIEILLSKLIEHIDVINYKDDKIVDIFIDILNSLFKNEAYLSDTEYDQSFILTLNLMMELEDTFLAKKIKLYLQESFTELLDNVLYTNYLKIIIPFLNVCYMYRLHNQLKTALQLMFTVEWDFLANDMNEREFSVIFWYAYMMGIEADLFDTISMDEVNEIKLKDEYNIYYYVYDCKNDLVIPNKQVYNKYKRLFRLGKALSEKEKEDVLKKIDDTMPPFSKQTNFIWPSTEIREDSTNTEEIELKQESDLKSFGYQITGLSRAKRWKVLQKAVPALGLYKVAYTIANHVRMRKGQKDGEVKFRHAISQWEHDLDRLKSTYYKNDFRWPSTKVRSS